MKRSVIYPCLFVLFVNCSQKTSDGFIKIKSEHLCEEVKIEFTKVRNQYDSIFASGFASGKNPVTIYRLRISNEEFEHVIEVKPDRIVTHTYQPEKRETKTEETLMHVETAYKELIQQEFMMLIDSAFWENPAIDNTAEVFDGTILEIEGIREGQYKKINRKAWTKDPKISLLAKYFKSH